jgi:hypothetical protein
MIAADLIQRAESVRIEDELERRGVTLKGHVERAGPCPVCGGTDRFGINTRKQSWNCRGCQLGGDVIALAMHLDGTPFAVAVETLTGDNAGGYKLSKNGNKVSTSINHQQRDDEQRRLELAARLFNEAKPLGAEAISYFAKRGIDIGAVPKHGGLRFHPRCPFDGQDKPCVLARYTDAISNKPRGIWRRPIDGTKPKALGPTAGCVIRLWPDDAVELGLVLGEGIETTLAAATRIEHCGTLLQPAWAAGFAQNMRRLPSSRRHREPDHPRGQRHVGHGPERSGRMCCPMDRSRA